MKIKNKKDALAHVLAWLYGELNSALVSGAPWLNHSIEEPQGDLDDVQSEHLAHEAAREVLDALHYLGIVAARPAPALVSVLHIHLARLIDGNTKLRTSVASLLADHERAITREWSTRAQALYSFLHSNGSMPAVQKFNELLRPLIKL